VLLGLNKKFSKRAFSELKTLAEYTQPVLVALRSEMKITSNIAKYRDSLEKRFTETDEMISNSFDRSGVENEN
jgi:hypothetical protein